MEQETPVTYAAFIASLERKLADAGSQLEGELADLPARVSEDPAACADACLAICELRADAEAYVIALRAAHLSEVARDLIGPADRLGASLLSTFDLVLDYGDWYSRRLYREAARGPLRWWTPMVEPFALAEGAPTRSLSELLSAERNRPKETSPRGE
jgi:hypothetical protein